MSNIINEVEKIVENQCKSKENAFGYGAWENHIKIVAKYSKLLAISMELDDEILELAALLHDFASVKDFSLYEEHHIHSSNLAEEVLSNLGYPENKVEIIKKCIYSHRASINIDRFSKEEVCLASADAMAHIDQVPSLLFLAYTKKNMSISDGTRWVKEKIDRSWNKLCDEAKEIIEEKYKSAKYNLDYDKFTVE